MQLSYGSLVYRPITDHKAGYTKLSSKGYLDYGSAVFLPRAHQLTSVIPALDPTQPSRSTAPDPLMCYSLRWRHNGYDSVSNHQPHGCLLNRLFRRRSKKTSKLRVTGLCAGNSPGPVNSPHKWPVKRKMFSFDDVIMGTSYQITQLHQCHNRSTQFKN